VDAANAVAAGDLTFPIDNRGSDEAAQLLHRFSDMQDSLRQRQQQDAQRMADAQAEAEMAQQTAEEINATVDAATQGDFTQRIGTDGTARALVSGLSREHGVAAYALLPLAQGGAPRRQLAGGGVGCGADGPAAAFGASFGEGAGTLADGGRPGSPTAPPSPNGPASAGPRIVSLSDSTVSRCASWMRLPKAASSAGASTHSTDV
jgi:hypothetical protein